MTQAKALRWCVVANVDDPHTSKLRKGARVVVVALQPDWRADRLRVEVRGVSLGGRVIQCFVAAKRLHNVRTAREWILPWQGFGDRTTTEGWVDLVNKARRGPLVPLADPR